MAADWGAAVPEGNVSRVMRFADLPIWAWPDASDGTRPPIPVPKMIEPLDRTCIIGALPL
jgi:hypothetical protein